LSKQLEFIQILILFSVCYAGTKSPETQAKDVYTKMLM